MAKMADKDAIAEAYSDVRNDSTATNWCALTYNENELSLDSSGEDFEDLKNKFEDGNRVFAYMRLQTGDEMSKRMKFVFILWVGTSVSPLKKAKMSTEKAFVKQLFVSFAIEMMFDDLNEVREESIRDAVMKAGGANYGTGR